jgi:hypothetical protein
MLVELRGCDVEDVKKRLSMVRLVLELVEQFIVLIFLELKLGVIEIKRNIHSAKTGAVLIVMGAALLLFSLVTGLATAIAALAIVLPVWLSALIVTALLGFVGAGFLFTGLSKVEHFTLVPLDTISRVEEISHKLKKHAEQHV